MTHATAEQLESGEYVCWVALTVEDDHVLAVEWERGAPEPAWRECVAGLRALRACSRLSDGLAMLVDQRGRSRWFAAFAPAARVAWQPRDPTGYKH